ncbi:hypothetical protein JAAARDRAFT_385217 [Jaapia argillacea MUCL 33604]|uniref:Ribosome biogenesis protein SLX9 n=1 Tax=Jaapia argillacea MUCL 33604 TaxID=933084 RepID=A0A067QLW0_9AGAM|nr:hypothetical protein JAAARDRAFT_385217 [Jaapia argillacea MUCL 33604]
MPKESRKRSSVHSHSVRPTKRKFAVQENAVESIEVGVSAEASGNDILQSMAEEAAVPQVNLTKKAKQQIKRELFLERLSSGHAPYSKSHARRIKRKGKEQIAGGLDDIKNALSFLDEGIQEVGSQSQGEDESRLESTMTKVKLKPGQIGEGKATPLTEAQRKRALETERLRHPMILANPAFSANPFQTIRTHAENTLIKR